MEVKLRSSREVNVDDVPASSATTYENLPSTRGGRSLVATLDEEGSTGLLPFFSSYPSSSPIMS